MLGVPSRFNNQQRCGKKRSVSFWSHSTSPTALPVHMKQATTGKWLRLELILTSRWKCQLLQSSYSSCSNGEALGSGSDTAFLRQRVYASVRGRRGGMPCQRPRSEPDRGDASADFGDAGDGRLWHAPGTQSVCDRRSGT